MAWFDRPCIGLPLCAGPRLICHRHGLAARQDCWILLDWCEVWPKLLHWSGFCWRCLSPRWTARASCSHIGDNCKWSSIPRVWGELAEDKLWAAGRILETCTVMENQAIPIRYRRSCIRPHQTLFPSPSVPAAFDFHPHPLPQHFSVLHIFVKLCQKYTGYTPLHNSQSHRISQSQALSARFIIFCFRYHGNTVLNATIPTVLPQSLSPLPRYYRSSCFNYRGKSAVTAVLPLSPLPCRSLIECKSKIHRSEVSTAFPLMWLPCPLLSSPLYYIHFSSYFCWFYFYHKIGQNKHYVHNSLNSFQKSELYYCIAKVPIVIQFLCCLLKIVPIVAEILQRQVRSRHLYQSCENPATFKPVTLGMRW